MTLLELYDRSNFLLQLFAAELVVCSHAEKRTHYALRLLGSFAPVFLLAIFLPDVMDLFPFDGLLGIGIIIGARYLIVFLLTMGIIALAYKVDFWSCLFYSVMAYAAQHIAYNGYRSLSTLLLVSLPTYGQALLLAAVSAACYGLLWLAFVRRLDRKTPIVVNNKYLLVLSAMVLELIVFVSFFGVMLSGSAGENRDTLRLIINLFSSSAALFCILLEVSILSIKRSELETLVLKRLVDSTREQYVRSKDNIDIINFKCHDLKHQISALQGKIEQAELDRISSAIDIYDSAFKTGSDALDVILVEKNLLCKEKHVRLTCMVRGEVFRDWSESDVYVLFGNAIDNALNAVEGLDEDKQLISIREERRGNISNIRIENYYQGEIGFEDGLPVTQKDRDFHGYGMKSIRMLVEKYNGELRVDLSHGIFQLNILLFT